ncbi:hypothetical protein PENSPDRAFT_661614 [Peniophora sp. CONT]|nr:hypothetical protein PENSPDRAFT_661614 [Peniophora sp. CONT]
MLSSTSLVLLSLFVSALASPSPVLDQRAAALTCPTFSNSDEPNSLTLLAVSEGTTFQRPLALGTVAGVAVIAASDTLTETLATNFILKDNGLYSDPVGWISDAVAANGLLSFTASTTGTAVPAYCDEFTTSPHGAPDLLTVGENVNGFALCTASNSVEVIVYEPVNGTTNPYDASTCVAVFLEVIHN